MGTKRNMVEDEIEGGSDIQEQTHNERRDAYLKREPATTCG